MGCKAPSPAGEGRGEENKIKCLHSPHPNPLLYALWVLWRGLFSVHQRCVHRLARREKEIIEFLEVPYKQKFR
jgi:hypothetical protein